MSYMNDSRMDYLLSQFVGMKWLDMPAFLSNLKPEDEKYVARTSLLRAIDLEVAKEIVKEPTRPIRQII